MMMVGRLEGLGGGWGRSSASIFFSCFATVVAGRGVESIPLGPNVQRLGCSRGPACCRRPAVERGAVVFFKLWEDGDRPPPRRLAVRLALCEVLNNSRSFF